MDVSRLPARDKIHSLQARARIIAHHQAALLETMTAILDEYETRGDASQRRADTPIDCVGDESDLELSFESTVAELRATLRLTRRAAEAQLELAWDLRDRLPAVLAALRHGEIDLPRVRVISQGTTHLSTSAARSAAGEALAVATHRTTGQLRALVQELCIDVDTDEALDRYTAAHGQRLVASELTDSGTATLWAADLPPDRVVAIMNRITRIAHGLKTSRETRSLDQLRADVFVDLLEAKTTEAANLGLARRGVGGYPGGAHDAHGLRREVGGAGRVRSGDCRHRPKARPRQDNGR